MDLYNIEKVSTLYKFTSHNVDVVQGITVYQGIQRRGAFQNNHINKGSHSDRFFKK